MFIIYARKLKFHIIIYIKYEKVFSLYNFCCFLVNENNYQYLLAKTSQNNSKINKNYLLFCYNVVFK